MISFTQLILPNATKRTISIDRESDIEDKYNDLAEVGFRFEIENNHGDIWATCIRDEEEYVDAFGFNGQYVPVLIDKLITDAWQKYIWKEM